MGSSTEPPAQPTGVETTIYDRHADRYIQIKWNNPKDTSASEYRIYRLENYAPEKTLKLIAVVPRAAAAGVQKYNDTNVESQHTYTYFVTGKDPFGNESHNSKMVRIQMSAFAR